MYVGLHCQLTSSTQKSKEKEVLGLVRTLHLVKYHFASKEFDGVKPLKDGVCIPEIRCGRGVYIPVRPWKFFLNFLVLTKISPCREWINAGQIRVLCTVYS